MFPEYEYEKELLHFAAQGGDLAQVERLVAAGYEVNAFDSLGMTPLHWAAKGEHFDVVAFLIDHGADVNAYHEPSIGVTALAEIAGNCSLEMARILVDAGADPTIRLGMRLNALDRAKERKRGDGPRVYALLKKAASQRRT